MGDRVVTLPRHRQDLNIAMSGPREALRAASGKRSDIVLQLAIEIAVVGEDDQPLEGVAVALRRDDDMESTGFTGRDGIARFEPLEFKRKWRFCLYRRDKDAWELVETGKVGSGSEAGRTETEWKEISTADTRGPKTHTVKPGECIESIAFLYGFFPEALWQDEGNRKLRELREDPNILFEGDTVQIPALRQKEEAAAIGKRYTVKTKGVPSKFRVNLVIDGKAMANTKYTLEVEKLPDPYQGTTGPNGEIDHWVPPDATQVVLRIDGHELIFMMGMIDPVTTRQGVIQRLLNLGYLGDDSVEDPDFDEELQGALCDFQESQDLTPTGKPDDATRRALVDACGG